MADPTEEALTPYFDPEVTYPEGAVTSALSTELANMRATATLCLPGPEEEWPADLVEALARRVQRNLATRPFPLGFMPNMDSGSTQFIGSLNAEIRRLEHPHRRIVVG